jgi:hypothetical protein
MLVLVAINRGAAVAARDVGSLSTSDLGSVTSFAAAVGTGQATLADGHVVLTLAAGESAVLTGH